MRLKSFRASSQGSKVSHLLSTWEGVIETGDVGHNSLLIRPQSAHDIYSNVSEKRERKRQQWSKATQSLCVLTERRRWLCILWAPLLKGKWGLKSCVKTVATHKVRGKKPIRCWERSHRPEEEGLRRTRTKPACACLHQVILVLVEKAMLKRSWRRDRGRGVPSGLQKRHGRNWTHRSL